LELANWQRKSAKASGEIWLAIGQSTGACKGDPAKMWKKLETVHVQTNPGAHFSYENLFSIRKLDESLSDLMAPIRALPHDYNNFLHFFSLALLISKNSNQLSTMKRRSAHHAKLILQNLPSAPSLLSSASSVAFLAILKRIVSRRKHLNKLNTELRESTTLETSNKAVVEFAGNASALFH
jgi:hypothetical protein